MARRQRQPRIARMGADVDQGHKIRSFDSDGDIRAILAQDDDIKNEKQIPRSLRDLVMTDAGSITR